MLQKAGYMIGLCAMLVGSALTWHKPNHSRVARQIGYLNASGQTITHLRITAGNDTHEFTQIPDRATSNIYAYGWGTLEGSVEGVLQNGSTFGPQPFVVPATTFSRARTIVVEHSGNVRFEGAIHQERHQ